MKLAEVWKDVHSTCQTQPAKKAVLLELNELSPTHVVVVNSSLEIRATEDK